MHLRMVSALGILVALTSCKTATNSSVESLAADAKAKNAVVIIGAPGQSKDMNHDNESESDFLPGVLTDVDHYKSLFQNKNIGEFRVVSTYAPSSIKDVTDKIKEAIRAVDDNGTLVVIYAGHGLPGTGDWDVQPDAINLTDIYPLIKQVRSVNEKGEPTAFKPLKRLIVISDSCYSGMLVERQQKAVNPAVMLEKNAQKGVDMLAKKNNGLNYASELLIIAASAPQSRSWDESWGRGGAFSFYLTRTFEQMTRGKKVTIGEWLDASISTINGWQNGEKQHPQFYVYPPTILNDYLFDEGRLVGPRPKIADDGADVCPGAFGYEWESHLAKPANGNPCVNPFDSCFCQAGVNKGLETNSVWGLFGPGLNIGDKPVATINVDKGSNRYLACKKLISMQSDYFHKTCKDRLVYINANDHLDAL